MWVPEYPKNWQEMRATMFKLYGGKYCTKGIFMKLGHDGFVNVHHAVPLSKSLYQSEYYFLNGPWNLVPLCEKHHIKNHKHMRQDEIKGKYDYKLYSKSGKVSWARRFCWQLKRTWYYRKFNKRKGNEKLLWFWNYWESGERNLEKEMNRWPGKCLEDLL